MFSKLASIVSQFSENEVSLDTTFREKKGEFNADMGKIAKDLVASQMLVDLEDFDTTPFMNEMTRVKKGLRDHVAENQKDLDTLRKECYQELAEEICATHKAYLLCQNYMWAFEITFTRGQKEPRYTGIVPLMQPNGTMPPMPARPNWWNADGTPTNASYFPHMMAHPAIHPGQNHMMQSHANVKEFKLWQFWCKLNNPFSDE
jgi:hypothetical protein